MNYIDDDGYETWCEENKEFIIEQYAIELSETYDKEIVSVDYNTIPEIFKEKLFRDFLENGKEDSMLEGSED